MSTFGEQQKHKREFDGFFDELVSGLRIFMENGIRESAFFASTFSFKKLYLIEMCFYLEGNTRFFNISIEVVLS